MRVSILGRHSAGQEERRTNLKYALFFLTVAVTLIVARQLGKDASTPSESPPTSNVRFDLSAQRASGEVAPRGDQSEFGGYVVRFRLSNRGNHPVFYPVRPGTNNLVGHVVYRTAAESEWIALPGSQASAVPSVQESTDQSVAWIEMPPGGWVDGQFKDSGQPGGEHAYAIDLQLERSAKAIKFVSPPYHFATN